MEPVEHLIGRHPTVPIARWSALLARLGGRPDEHLAAALAAAWAEPHRVYHGTAHLRDCLRELDGTPADGGDRDAAEAALWFHDAVYDPRAGDNEERSARWAESALPAAGVAAERASEISRLVRATRHDRPPGDAAAGLVCDVDLSILARPPAEYEEFERRIRAEYAWVPEPHFRRERRLVLQGLLERRPLYATPHFRPREAAARENLARAVARLQDG